MKSDNNITVQMNPELHFYIKDARSPVLIVSNASHIPRIGEGIFLPANGYKKIYVIDYCYPFKCNSKYCSKYTVNVYVK